MSSYGINGTNFSTFSDDEKLNYALKIALARVQTDVKKAWFIEPNDFVPQFPETIYKHSLPDYFDINNYLLIDPDYDNSGKEKVTNISVENILQSSSKGSQYKLSDILDVNKVRNPDASSNAVFVAGTNNTQVEKLGRNMFTRYKYWRNHLTGKDSSWSTTDKSDMTTTHSAGSQDSGTYPQEITEPENSSITLNNVVDSTNTHLSYINNSRTFKNINTNSTFHQKLKDHSVSIDLISPTAKKSDGSFDLTKKHPFLKIYLQLPLYSTYNDSIEYKTDPNSTDITKSDNIAFTNPVLNKSLGDKENYQYRIVGYENNSWNNVTTSLGDSGNKNILYFLNNPGFVLSFGAKKPIDGNLISARYPPMISFLRYTGETLAEGIISQGVSLPTIANKKDLFIDTSSNTLYRYDISGISGEWIAMTGGGGGSGGSNVSSSELQEKADIKDPSFVGIPKAPTAALGTNTLQIATTEFVDQSIRNNANLLKYHASNAPVQLLLPIIDEMNNYFQKAILTNKSGQSFTNILTQQPEKFTIDPSYNIAPNVSDASNVILMWNYDDIILKQEGTDFILKLSIFDNMKKTNIPNIDEIVIEISGNMTDNSWNIIKKFTLSDTDDYNTSAFKKFIIKNTEVDLYSRRVYNSFLNGDAFQIGIYGKNASINYRTKEERMLIFNCSFNATSDISHNSNIYSLGSPSDISANVGASFNNVVVITDSNSTKSINHSDMSGCWKNFDISGISGTPNSYKWIIFRIKKNSLYIKTAKHKTRTITLNYIDVPLLMKHEGFDNATINHFGKQTTFTDASGNIGFMKIDAIDYNRNSVSKICHFMKNTRTNPTQLWYSGLNSSNISLNHLLNEIKGNYYGGLIDTGNYIVDNKWGIQCPKSENFTSDNIFIVIGEKI